MCDHRCRKHAALPITYITSQVVGKFDFRDPAESYRAAAVFATATHEERRAILEELVHARPVTLAAFVVFATSMSAADGAGNITSAAALAVRMLSEAL